MNPTRIHLMDLELEASALSSMAFALQEAFEHGDGDADTYVPGMWLFANLVHDHAQKIKDYSRQEDRK